MIIIFRKDGLFLRNLLNPYFYEFFQILILISNVEIIWKLIKLINEKETCWYLRWFKCLNFE